VDGVTGEEGLSMVVAIGSQFRKERGDGGMVNDVEASDTVARGVG
jgi:hypothetical protein